MKRPIVLTIAGSDPGGGAGIQADLRTFGALGVIGLSVITGLTVQNSQGVLAVHPIDAEIVDAQLEAIISDTRPDAVKIGMLSGLKQARAVADVLRRFALPNVVLDPVLASTGGVPLLDANAYGVVINDLLPLCRVVTPNQDEWRALPGLGAIDVLLKGGHLDGAPTDVLISADGKRQEFPGERIATVHTHGTGCFLSSALAAFLAHGLTLEDAVFEAKSYLTKALRSPVVAGQGRGYPEIPTVPRDTQTHAQRMKKLRGIYVLTDPDLRPDRDAAQVTRAVIAGGARIVQLRDKHRSTPDLVDLARRLTDIAHSAGALLIVNDRVDVALVSGADGVHLGPDDMHPRDARRLLGPEKIVGISVSTTEESSGLAQFVSYLGVGAIYGTATKSDAGPAVGLDRIREIKAAYPVLPLVAIGGIGLENIADVASAGADAAAVVSAVVCAQDMQAATTLLRERFTAV